MKILNLKIIDNDGAMKQNIDFHESGVSFIFGNVEKKEDSQKTSNSIGKSTLISMIDFSFGSDTKFKNGLEGVLLIAEMLHSGTTYTIEREILGAKKITVKDRRGEIIKELSGRSKEDLAEYREFFDIDRNMLNLQIIKTQKNGLVSQHNKRPNKLELVSFLSLLNLAKLATITEKICDVQEIYDKEKVSVKKIFEETRGIKYDEKALDKEIFILKDQLEMKEKEMLYLREKTKELEIAEEYEGVSLEHEHISSTIKDYSSELNLLKRELNRIEAVLEESKTDELEAKKIIKLLNKSKQEVPNYIVKTLEEVEDFHKSVVADRKNMLKHEQTNISIKIDEYENELEFLKAELNRLGLILSQSSAHQKALELYSKVSSELQSMKFDEGKLSVLETGSTKLKEYDINLVSLFSDLQNAMIEYDETINVYREFINAFTKKLYGDDKTGVLEVRDVGKHVKHKPIQISLTITDDSEDGVGQVKKNLIDYLLFEFTKKVDLLVQDSSCFAKVDTRQICNMIIEASNIAEKNNKQYIAAINKYELGNDNQVVQFVKKNSKIILSEEDVLMKRKFE